ncbi:MAG: YjbQ family protein [Candidatus Lokiarchaeota archaeon]|nr:YjbQ family protein [Candidatus Lokiarchaeota archaeon]
MVVILEKFSLDTQPEDIIDITPEIKKKLDSCGLTQGIVCIFTASSTSAISTTEYEPGLIKGDIPAFLEKIIPYDRNYEHHKTWGDHNGGGHLRSFLLNPSLTIPFTASNLILGTWQQIIFLEMDEKPRTRLIYCQFIGE